MTSGASPDPACPVGCALLLKPSPCPSKPTPPTPTHILRHKAGDAAQLAHLHLPPVDQQAPRLLPRRPCLALQHREERRLARPRRTQNGCQPAVLEAAHQGGGRAHGRATVRAMFSNQQAPEPQAGQRAGREAGRHILATACKALQKAQQPHRPVTPERMLRPSCSVSPTLSN